MTEENVHLLRFTILMETATGTAQLSVIVKAKCFTSMTIALLYLNMELFVCFYICRGKHLCSEKLHTDYYNTEFPGITDHGTPLVLEENGHATIIGIFLYRLNSPAMYAQIDSAIVNWIYDYADWTQAGICMGSTDR